MVTLTVKRPELVWHEQWFVARSLQVGNMQGHTFLLGAGVVLVIYVAVFVLPRIGG